MGEDHEHHIEDPATSLRQQVYFWLFVFAITVLAIYLMREILLPFFAGMVLAYFLDPVADWLEAHGFSRVIATSLILLAFIVIFVVALIVVVPILASQFAGLAERLPSLVRSLQDIIADNKALKAVIGEDGKNIRENLNSVLQQGAQWVSTVLTSLWSSGKTIFSVISLLVITPIVAFYLLLDWDRMVAKIDDNLPREHKRVIRRIARDMDKAIAGFVRGQGSVCLLLGSFYAVALTLTGLNFGLLIGMFAGIISFIPFVGSIVGLILSVGVALVQFWPDYWMVIIVAAIFAFGQFVEGNFLQPNLVGKSIGIHPVWLMFALTAFGSLFGFTGLLIAVPVAAAIGVLVRFALDQYKQSPLYRGRRVG